MTEDLAALLHVEPHLLDQPVHRLEPQRRAQPLHQLEHDPLAVQVEVGAVQARRPRPGGWCRRRWGWCRSTPRRAARAAPSRPSEGRSSQPAYTPSAGTMPCESGPRLAVGKPSSRPRWSPCTTVPVTRCGRPSARAAPSTSPSASASRTPVEDQRAADACGCRSSRTSTSKPCTLAQLAQGAHVTGVAVAEPGVGADHDGARVQHVDEDALHEALGRPLGQLRGERHDQRGVQAGGRHQVQPLVQAGDQLGRAVREEHLHRVRVEGDRHGRGGQRAGALHDAGQHGAVPGVHTVEVAQGHDSARQVGRDVVQVVPALHGGQRTARPEHGRQQASRRPSARGVGRVYVAGHTG